jgi:hypothetical protein
MAAEHRWTQTRRGHPSRDPALRASDADREAIAEILRRQHADGRIDTLELQERLEVCYRSRTLGELERLLADLPHDAEGPMGESSGRAAHRGVPWRATLLPLLPIVLVVAAICGATGRHAVWLAVPVAFLILRLAQSRYGGRWQHLSDGHDRSGRPG